MDLTRKTWQTLLRSVWPYAVLIAVLAGGLIGFDRLLGSSSASTSGQSGLSRSVIQPPICGAQLGRAGYSITPSTAANARQTAQAVLGLGANDIAAEFMPLTSTSPALQSDPAARAMALDRMQVVRGSAFGRMSQGALVAKLQSAAGVAAAEPIWLQSSDKRYLSCDYKLADNTTDQALAASARQALIAHGISGALLEDAGTMEFVSLRHFDGRQLLQVAFVRRPVGQPSAAYVAVMNPGSQAVLAVAQANWYVWG